MDTQPAQPNYVELKLTSKGLYHWNIKTSFDSADLSDQITEKLKNIDSKLRDKFAKNVSELITRSKFSEVDDLD